MYNIIYEKCVFVNNAKVLLVYRSIPVDHINLLSAVCAGGNAGFLTEQTDEIQHVTVTAQGRDLCYCKIRGDEKLTGTLDSQRDDIFDRSHARDLSENIAVSADTQMLHIGKGFNSYFLRVVVVDEGKGLHESGFQPGRKV